MIVDDVMMTRGGKKWLVTYTAPYTSYMCSIEFKWCDGKGYAARPINQRTGRSPAQVVNLVRSKWYDVCLEKLPIDPAVWIKHCHREMNDRIKMWSEDPDISTDSFPLRGDIYDFENFKGYPKDEIEWKEYYKKAGMTKGYLHSGGVETLAEFRADKYQLDEAMTYDVREEIDGDIQYLSDIDDFEDEEDEFEVSTRNALLSSSSSSSSSSSGSSVEGSKRKSKKSKPSGGGARAV